MISPDCRRAAPASHRRREEDSRMTRQGKGSTHKVVFGVHPAVRMVQKAMAGLKEKTGRTLDEWLVFIKKAGPATEAERRDWLKKEHGLGTSYAGWLAERSVGKGADLGDAEKYLAAAPRYVEALFSGPKTGLRS